MTAINQKYKMSIQNINDNSFLLLKNFFLYKQSGFQLEING